MPLFSSDAPRNLPPVTQISAVSRPVPIVPTAPRTSAYAGNWSAGANETLRDILTRWSQQNGSDLVWSIDYDYRLKEPVSLSGSYTDAVQSLLDAFKKAEPRPYGELFANKSGGHTLVIRAYGL